MERETAGDPISGLKWTRKTTDKIARQLKRLGIAVSRSTVGRLLRQMRYSLRTNRKKISAGSTADRDRQFRFLCRQRDRFEKRGDPVLSVDAKKRELIGNFKNPGVKWEPSTTDVNDHDFRSTAKGIGIPYGIYDTQANRGCVFLGTSHETSAFAVSCLRKSWNPKCLRDGGRHGMRTYFVKCKTPDCAAEILITVKPNIVFPTQVASVTLECSTCGNANRYAIPDLRNRTVKTRGTGS